MNAKALAAALLAMYLLFYAWNLGGEELSDVDEGRSGTIVKDMAEGGRWLLPRTPEGAYSEKPIVYYGLCAALSAVLGMNEWALRGVSVLAAVGTLALTWTLTRLYAPPPGSSAPGFGRMDGSARAPAIAVVALGSNVIFMTWARMAYVDLTLTFFLTAALTAYFAARRKKFGVWPAALTCGAASGLATLTKGPMGLALPLAVVGCDLLVTTRGRFWRAAGMWGPAAASLAVAVGIALAWYLPGYARGGESFLQTSVYSENLFMPLGQARGLGVSHYKDWHFYLRWQLLAFLPVLPLLPEAVRWAARRDAGPARAHLAAWFLIGFALFMAAANKRRYYLLPLQPALAAMIGLGADRWLETGVLTPWRRAGASVTGALSALAGVAGVVIGCVPSLTHGILDNAGNMPWDLSSPALIGARGSLVAFSALGVGVGAALLAAAFRGPLHVARAAVGLGLFVTAFRSEVYTSLTAASNHTRPFVEEMKSKVPAGVRPVIVDPIHGYALDFYWPGGLVWYGPTVDSARWLLLPTRQLERFPAVEVIGVLKSGDPDKDVALVRRK